MALSMLAAGFLYGSKNTDDNPIDVPTPTATAFDYTLNFDTQAIKELGSARFVTYTSELDKTRIDSQIMKIEGVSKIISQFKKETPDANKWIYYGELTIKKGADLETVLTSISDLNVFIKADGIQAMKYVTISVPSSIMLHNSDLNIDRNFSFPTTTLSSLVNIYTSPSDKLNVSGSIKVQGSAILYIELIEKKNYTKEELYSQVITEQASDENTPISVEIQ
jgi:hypothetical protein